jgi:hypothetical protein
MRRILVLVGIVGVGLIGLSYYGQGLSMSILSQFSVGVSGAAPAIPNSQAEVMKNNLKTIFKLWALVRYAGFGLLVLAIIGFRRSGNAR